MKKLQIKRQTIKILFIMFLTIFFNSQLLAQTESILSIKSKATIKDTVVFEEDFESYPIGTLADAPGTPWIQYRAGRNGDVTTNWVHDGQKNFMTASFMFSTEKNYVNLNLDNKPDQLHVELWYSPDGFYTYKEFAVIGLSNVLSQSDMTEKASFWGEDTTVKFQAEGMGSDVTVFDQLEYGSGPNPSGSPKHNYIRAEFDFIENEVRFFIGPDSTAPLQSNVYFDGSIEFNALFISGGLNPTFIDDIRVTSFSLPQYNNDVGVLSIDMPDTVNLGASIPVGVIVQNFGTVDQSNFPVSYQINNGTIVTENFSEILVSGASTKKTFNTPWITAELGTHDIIGWTSLSVDENVMNDSLITPKQVFVHPGFTNNEPELSLVGNHFITAGQTKNVSISAIDNDEDILSFSIPDNPGFLSIADLSQTGVSATATLVISPSFNFAGLFNASIQVSDGKGGIDSENFSIEVVTASKGNWTYQNPLNGRGDFNDIQFIDAEKGWMVNNLGEIHKSTNGGNNWTIQYDANYQLTNIFFIDDQVGWAVGSNYSNSSILKTIDGGTTWIFSTTDKVNRIRSLYFVSNLIGWIVGNDNNQNNVIIKTIDGGANWNVQKSLASSADNYNSIYFVDTQTGWVVGRLYDNPDIILKTTDGGANWNSQTTNTNTGLQSVCFVNPQEGWAVGRGTIIHTTDGGTTWTEQTSGTTRLLNSVYFIDNLTGWAVGEVYGGFGTILKTNNGGSTWVKKDGGDTNKNIDLMEVHFYDAYTGWAVGDLGVVLKTTDGGTSWDNLSGVTLETLYSIYFLSENIGWAAGTGGTLLKTENGGLSWTSVYALNGYRINDIYFADSQTGWACRNGGRIIRSTNGGVNWQEKYTGSTTALHSLFFLDAQTGWAAGGGAVSRLIFKTVNSGDSWTQKTVPDGKGLMDIFFVDANTGWAVGMNGTILKTINGGDSWIAQNSGRTDWLEDVFFFDTNNGFVGGSKGILHTQDGGTTWDFDEAGDGWIEDIIFCDSLNGFAVGAVGSILSKSIDGYGSVSVSGGRAKTWITNDGGKTWSEDVVSVGGWLLQGFFTDQNSGWAVGNAGTIVKYHNILPIPAPPSNLTAHSISATKIQLDWSDNATNEVGFYLYRSDGISGAYQLLATVNTDTISYLDSTVTEGTTYWYRIRTFNSIGVSAYTLEALATAGFISSIAYNSSGPTEYTLEQNFPNPFNPSTTIKFALPKTEEVKIEVFNAIGQKVTTLLDKQMSKGIHEVLFDAPNLPSGVYVYKIDAGDFIAKRKCLLLK